MTMDFLKNKERKKEKEAKEKEIKAKEVSQRKKEIFDGWKILREPHITEKATDLAKENQYVFKVFPKANKNQVKKAVEGLYEVDVLSVKIVKIPAKRRRLGRVSGWKKGFKKAIVKIKEGQKIEVMPK
jgi:large subunit ribosomal protein L23